MIRGSALLRAPLSALERLSVSMKKGQAKRMPDPIFIIGHWRSGTTHLYNILSQASQFGYVSPFATALPWNFLGLGRHFKGLLRRSLPEHRYIDNVPVTPESPQEDEFALANMTGLSYYHALYFPRQFEDTFKRGIWFDGASNKEIELWKKRLKYFYTKLQIEHPGTTLLIKNPAHTSRINMLARMFPESKFIHIHRNPYTVFYSMRNFYDKLLNQLALQSWSHIDIDEHIFSTYLRMMEDLDLDWATLGKQRFMEVRFDDLQHSPIEVLLRIYDVLGLTRFHQAMPMYESYLASVKSYEKNSYTYEADVLDKIGERWSMYINRWHYQRPEPGQVQPSPAPVTVTADTAETDATPEMAEEAPMEMPAEAIMESPAEASAEAAEGLAVEVPLDLATPEEPALAAPAEPVPPTTEAWSAAAPNPVFEAAPDQASDEAQGEMQAPATFESAAAPSPTAAPSPEPGFAEQDASMPSPAEEPASSPAQPEDPMEALVAQAMAAEAQSVAEPQPVVPQAPQSPPPQAAPPPDAPPPPVPTPPPPPAPAQPAPPQAAPVQAEPVQAEPSQTAPSEAVPSQATPVQTEASPAAPLPEQAPAQAAPPLQPGPEPAPAQAAPPLQPPAAQPDQARPQTQPQPQPQLQTQPQQAPQPQAAPPLQPNPATAAPGQPQAPDPAPTPTPGAPPPSAAPLPDAFVQQPDPKPGQE